MVEDEEMLEEQQGWLAELQGLALSVEIGPRWGAR